MWKKIEQCKCYSINENGEVRNDRNGRIKKATVCKCNGYKYVDLWENNKSHKITVHRLLAEAFIPNPENKKTVDHKDGDRTNNSLDNLRWATYSENNSRFNTKGVRSKEIIAIHENGNVLEFDRIKDAAEYFDCNISNISQMLKKGTFGKRGKMRHYKFQYKFAKV